MFAMAQGGLTMPEADWETQILLIRCQVRFCLLQKTDGTEKSPALQSRLPAWRVVVLEERAGALH